MTKFITVAAGIIALVMCDRSANANFTSPVSLGDQANRADLIVIGKARRLAACNVKREYRRCLELSEVSVLRKNDRYSREPTLWVILDVGVDELTVECCEINKYYLVFINKSDGLYFPFFGQSSVRRLAD